MIEKEDKLKYSNETVGYINYAFNWRTEKKEGYIVQKITRTVSEKTITYWEAWYVDEKGNIRIEHDKDPVPTSQDSWTWLSIKWGAPGNLKITGDVYWVANGSEAATAVAKWKPGSITQAGGLKSSKKEPGGLENPVLTETKEWSWDTRAKTAEQFLQVFNTKWETSYKNWEDWEADCDGNIDIIIEDLIENFSDIPIKNLKDWVRKQVISRLD